MIDGHDIPETIILTHPAYSNLVIDEWQMIPAVDAFCRGYAEALLWANTYVGEEHDDYCEADGGFVDYAYAYQSPGRWWENIGIDYTDAIDFLAANFETLSSIPHDDRLNTYGFWECMGHDFALTRNGHGAGFWDRGYGDIGDTLTRVAHLYGTHNLYVDADDKIWNE